MSSARQDTEESEMERVSGGAAGRSTYPLRLARLCRLRRSLVRDSLAV